MRLALTMLTGAAMIASLAATLPAVAGPYDRDHVYADSFGNLVVQSASGYKRIVVGEGGNARKLRDYVSGLTIIRGGALVEDRDCWRPPALVKGRSYMYGFDQGEIPFRGGECR